MKNPTGKKLIASFIIPVALVQITIIVLFSVWLLTKADGLAAEQISYVGAAGTEIVQSQIESVEYSVLAAADVLMASNKSVRDNADFRKSLIESILKNPSVRYSWFISEPGVFANQNSRDIICYFKDGDSVMPVSELDKFTYSDLSSFPSYINPLNSRDIYVGIKAIGYSDTNMDMEALSISVPIIMEGRVVGCIGAEIFIKDLLPSINELDEEFVYALIASDYNVFYSNSGVDRVAGVQSLNFSDEDVFSASTEAKKLTFDLITGKSIATYLPIVDNDSSKLYFMAAMAADTVLKDLSASFVAIIALVLLTVIVIVIFVMFLTRRLLRPIETLISATDAISDENVDIEMQMFSDRNDQIGVLSNSISKIAEQFRIAVSLQESTNKQVSIYSYLSQILQDKTTIFEAFNFVTNMLCRFFAVQKATAIFVKDGNASVLSVYDIGNGFTEIDDENPPDFPGVGYIEQLLGNKEILNVNWYTINSMNIFFMDERTINASILPISQNNTVFGYIILENTDANKPFVNKNAFIIIGITKMLSDWLKRRVAAGDAEDVSSGFEPQPIYEEKQGEKVVNSVSGTAEILSFAKSLGYIDVDIALEAMGGLTDVYAQVLLLLKKTLPETVVKLDGYLDTDNKAFMIEVHGLKGALKNIGAKELGLIAYDLEKAAKNEERKFIEENYPDFKRKLDVLLTDIEIITEEEAMDKPYGNTAELLPVLESVREALENFDNEAVISLLNGASAKLYTDEIDAYIKTAIAETEKFNYGGAEKIVEDIIKKIG